MTDELTKAAYYFVDQAYQEARAAKHDATDLEVFGMAVSILSNTFAHYKQNEQLQNSSDQESSEGAERESEQVQGTGSQGRSSESTEGVRKEQRGTTKSGGKQRRQ